MDEDRLNEITRYLQSNPTPPESVGGNHIHVHHHYAAPVISNAPVDQNPGQSVLEKYAPYYVMFLGGIIIVAGVTVVLMFAFAAIAMILLVVLGCIVGTALLGVVLVLLMRSHSESRALRDLARSASTRKR